MDMGKGMPRSRETESGTRLVAAVVVGAMVSGSTSGSGGSGVRMRLW